MAIRSTLLIASNNEGKRREFTELLRDFPFDLRIPSDIGLVLEVNEDGDTYEENAGHKALTFARSSGLIAIADDSGIEVAAFGAWPGIHSVRFAGNQADDNTRRLLILKRLGHRHGNERAARFVCAVAVARPDRIIAQSVGVLEGSIADVEAGQSGFGYDSIFIPRGYAVTLAQIGEAEKNAISHRARAIAGVRTALELLANSAPSAPAET